MDEEHVRRARVAVVHQPHFVPWLGYYNKLANADVWVVQDDVQFRRRYFQNRTVIRNPQGQPAWLTLPVHAERNSVLRDVRIATSSWPTHIRRSLQHSYGSAKYYRHYADAIMCSFRECDRFLVDITLSSLRATLTLLELPVSILLSSDVLRSVPLPNRTERIVNACLRVNATGYIFGEGGGALCHSVQALRDRDIIPIFQRFSVRFQQALANYVPTALNVSIVEYLFSLGAAATRELIRQPWTLESRGNVC